MFQWATTTATYLRKVWNKLLGLVGLSSTSEPTTGKRPRSVSDGFESYVLPIKPIRIRAVPGDLRSGEATYTVGSAHLTQSCPELRRRTRGTKIQWDPRNVICEDAMEDERKARSAIMRMYR